MYSLLPSTTSTMDEAAVRVAESDTTTRGVAAKLQTAGRGRLGRVWQTFAWPHSLAVTYIAHPQAGQAWGPHVPLVVALALHTAIRQLWAQAPVAIKWPNDILLHTATGPKKLAGILCQTAPTRHGPPAMLVGVGLNLSRPAAGVPESFVGGFLWAEHAPEEREQGPQAATGATSALPGAGLAPLAAAAEPPFWMSHLGACLFYNLQLYSKYGWAPFHHNYARHCHTIGQRVSWKSQGNQELTGTARGLNHSGHLELVADDGTVHVIHSGEIIAQARA